MSLQWAEGCWRERELPHRAEHTHYFSSPGCVLCLFKISMAMTGSFCNMNLLHHLSCLSAFPSLTKLATVQEILADLQDWSLRLQKSQISGRRKSPWRTRKRNSRNQRSQQAASLLSHAETGCPPGWGRWGGRWAWFFFLNFFFVWFLCCFCKLFFFPLGSEANKQSPVL